MLVILTVLDHVAFICAVESSESDEYAGDASLILNEEMRPRYIISKVTVICVSKDQ